MPSEQKIQQKKKKKKIQQQSTLVLKKIKTVKMELLKSRHSGKSYTNETSSFLRFTLFKFAKELWGKQSIDENKTLAMINTWAGFSLKKFHNTMLFMKVCWVADMCKKTEHCVVKEFNFCPGRTAN